MDLYSRHPFWLLRHGLLNNFPSLNENTSTEAVVMGAGISGALTAYYLHQAGIKVIVVDRRHAGTGSTVASTSLLQYEIDIPLHKLIKKAGEKNAVRSYLLCTESIDALENICGKLKDPGIFENKPSFQFASFKKDVNDLCIEYKLRKKIGIPVRWLEPRAIKEKFGFHKDGGILSGIGAHADAYKITHLILKKLQREGVKVYDHTEIADIHYHKRRTELITASQKKISTKALVIACGYESLRYLPEKKVQLHSTFAIASEPITTTKNFWYKNALIWETAQPYLYLRTTPDKRIIIGGKDVPFSNAAKRDKLLGAKKTSLEKAFSHLFPGITFKTDFAWAGTFATTKDGLPYIGTIPQKPCTYFALGFGGNGILFSVIAAEIITDAITGKKNRQQQIFSFDR